MLSRGAHPNDETVIIVYNNSNNHDNVYFVPPLGLFRISTLYVSFIYYYYYFFVKQPTSSVRSCIECIWSVPNDGLTFYRRGTEF